MGLLLSLHISLTQKTLFIFMLSKPVCTSQRELLKASPSPPQKANNSFLLECCVVVSYIVLFCLTVFFFLKSVYDAVWKKLKPALTVIQKNIFKQQCDFDIK